MFTYRCMCRKVRQYSNGILQYISLERMKGDTHRIVEVYAQQSAHVSSSWSEALQYVMSVQRMQEDAHRIVEVYALQSAHVAASSSEILQYMYLYRMNRDTHRIVLYKVFTGCWTQIILAHWYIRHKPIVAGVIRQGTMGEVIILLFAQYLPHLFTPG